MQVRLLEAAGCDVIFREQQSAVKSRPVLSQALKSIRRGDTLVVFKLDRLARSLKQLLSILEMLDQRGAGFKSLTEPIDTTTAAGRMMLQILGAVAEFERSLIVERTKAGHAAARARGVKFGRQRALSLDDETELVERYLDRPDGVTMAMMAAEYGVSISSVKRAVYRVVKPDSSSLQ